MDAREKRRHARNDQIECDRLGVEAVLPPDRAERRRGDAHAEGVRRTAGTRNPTGYAAAERRGARRGGENATMRNQARARLARTGFDGSRRGEADAAHAVHADRRCCRRGRRGTDSPDRSLRGAQSAERMAPVSTAPRSTCPATPTTASTPLRSSTTAPPIAGTGSAPAAAGRRPGPADRRQPADVAASGGAPAFRFSWSFGRTHLR
jgi:hypothetical protein